MEFENEPLRWDNQGTEPSEELKQGGFEPGMKPPADVFNYFYSNTGACTTELQNKLSATKEELQNNINSKADTIHTHTLDEVSETAAKKVMTNDERTKLEGIEQNANHYTLPTASEGVLGGVKVGGNLKISSGTINSVGKDVTGQTFALPPDGTEVTAGTGAEVFNDYRAAVYDANTKKIQIGNISSGDYSTAHGTANAATGSCSFAAGNSNTVEGEGSFAMGKNCKARGNFSVAMGSGSEANKGGSFAMGVSNKNNGVNSVTIGNSNTTGGSYSVAMGRECAANNECAVSMGRKCNAFETNSVAMGMSNSASGESSVAMGKSNTADGLCSVAIGNDNTSGGTSSIAMGEICIASGENSIAMGYESTAGGYCSVALGQGAQASIMNAIALGCAASAAGIDSVAIGCECTATGDSAFATGYSTKCNSFQFVTGKCNIESSGPGMNDTTGDIFIVGNGTIDGTSTTPGNAFRITTAGEVYGQSAFGSSGADYAEFFEWEDGNQDNEDRRGLFVTLTENGKIRRATAEDSYILGVVSATPCIFGDVQSEEWQGKYLKDIFGQKLTTVVQVEEKTDERTGEVIPAHTETRWILNPDYNPDEEYISRKERQEWGMIGLLGKLIVIDDGTAKAGCFCKVGKDGLATDSEDTTGWRVLKRLDENHIQIFYR